MKEKKESKKAASLVTAEMTTLRVPSELGLVISGRGTNYPSHHARGQLRAFHSGSCSPLSLGSNGILSV